MVKNYKSELECKRKAGEPDLDMQVLKRGHPFLLGEKVNAQTQAYIQAVQDAGGVTLHLQLARLSCVNTMLNKNTLGIKKCEANQKQHCKHAGRCDQKL